MAASVSSRMLIYVQEEAHSALLSNEQIPREANQTQGVDKQSCV